MIPRPHFLIASVAAVLLSSCSPATSKSPAAPPPDPVLGGKKASEWVQRLRSKVAPEAQDQCASILAGGGAAAAPQLVEGLKSFPTDDPGFEALPRLRVARVLGRIGAPAVPAVRAGLASDNPAIRNGCLEALEFMGAPGAPAVPDLRAILAGKDVLMISNACKALSAIGPAAVAAEPDLVRLMRDTGNPNRGSAICAAGRFRPTTRPIAEALVDAVGDARWANMATTAVRGAGEGMRAALPLAEQRIREGKTEGMWSVYSAIGDKDGIPIVLGLMRDPSAEVRRAATGITGVIYRREAKVVSALEAALEDADAGVKEAAAKSLKEVDAAAAERHGIK